MKIDRLIAITMYLLNREYEQSNYLGELFQLCKEEFFPFFGVKQIITKAVPSAAVRRLVIADIGFHPYSFIDRMDYFILNDG